MNQSKGKIILVFAVAIVVSVIISLPALMREYRENYILNLKLENAERQAEANMQWTERQKELAQRERSKYISNGCFHEENKDKFECKTIDWSLISRYSSY